MAPNTITFNIVLSAWARCADRFHDAPKKAEDLLKLQLELVETNVLRERADSLSFAAVILAYARSNDPAKTQNAYRLLRTMLAAIADGTVLSGTNPAVAFTNVLNAAVFSRTASVDKNDADSDPEDDNSSPINTSGFDTGENEADNAYTIALQTYRELKEDSFRLGCKPDHMAFAAMLNVVREYTDESSTERSQMVQLVFEDACAAGEVSRVVIRALERASPDKEFLGSLLKNEELREGMIRSSDELPGAWTRNVGRKFRK